MADKKFNTAIGVMVLWCVLCMGMAFTHQHGWALLTTLCVVGAFASGYAVPCKVYAWTSGAIGETVATVLACILMITCIGSTSWVFIGLFVKPILGRFAFLVIAYGLLYGATKRY